MNETKKFSDYKIDKYIPEWKAWTPTGKKFEIEKDAIMKMDEMFFSNEEFSYRIVHNKKIIAKRLRDNKISVNQS